MMYYDPPEGWRYGFPKPYRSGVNLRHQLVEDGYPPQLIDDVVLNYCRFFTKEDND